jgi:hypothetical protein
MINLTQHLATAEQLAAGVVEPEDKARIAELLTFATLPARQEIEARASVLAHIAKSSGYKAAMIGGAPFLMEPLERHLAYAGVKSLYAFSVRESAEEVQSDGSVKKVNVFRHAGFVGE